MGREGLQSRKVHLVDEVFGIPVLVYEQDHIDHIDGDIFYIASLMEIVIAEDVGLPYSVVGFQGKLMHLLQLFQGIFGGFLQLFQEMFKKNRDTEPVERCVPIEVQYFNLHFLIAYRGIEEKDGVQGTR